MRALLLRLLGFEPAGSADTFNNYLRGLTSDINMLKLILRANERQIAKLESQVAAQDEQIDWLMRGHKQGAVAAKEPAR